MKIGILSDIHGYPETFKKALTYFRDCELIFCAGDILYHGPRNPILEGYNPKGLIQEIENNKIPMLIARGNCDAEVDQMVLKMPVIFENVFFEKDGVRFLMLHGHNSDDESLKNMAEYYKADIVITGHTHIRMFKDTKSTLYINPGSISVPKGDGRPSIAIYEDGAVLFYDINTGEQITCNP